MEQSKEPCQEYTECNKNCVKVDVKRGVFRTKPDPIFLKFYPDIHPLSVEEQKLFVKLTEGAFGFDEHIRDQSLYILSKDYHVKFLASYFSTFIKNVIETNIAFPDLSLLIYAVRMVKSLIMNPHIDMKEHLHLILPPVLSCVLSKKISKYPYDNHWTLRDFSAQIIAQICCNYANEINQMRNRIMRLYLIAIQDPHKSFTSIYGGLKGLSCFGAEVIKGCIISGIPRLSRRVYLFLEQVSHKESNVDRTEIKAVIDLLINITGPILAQTRNPNETAVNYVKDYGYLGYSLYLFVENLQKKENERKASKNFVYFLSTS